MKRILFILISLLSICGSVCLASDEKSNNIVLVTTPGSLSTLLTQAQKDTCTQLTVRGKLNSADIKTLRHMAGYEEEGCSTGQLQILNLADAEFVTDKEPYMVLDAAKEFLTVTAVPTTIRVRTEEHRVNDNVSPILDYRSFTSKLWRASQYTINLSNKDLAGDLITNWMPKFFLGHVGCDSVKLIAHVHLNPTEGSDMYREFRTSFLINDGQHSFSKGVSVKDWKTICKRGLNHYKGHHLIIDDNKYKLEASCQKNHIPADMFYGCPTIHTVVLPKKASIDYTIVDEQSQIKYIQSSPTHIVIDYIKGDWNKVSGASVLMLESKEKTKRTIVKDAETIEALNKQIVSLKFIESTKPQDFRVKLEIFGKGSADVVTLYCNADYIMNERTRETAQMNAELLALLRKLKVYSEL